MTIACPGPVATGSEATPRNVFSSQGLTAKHEERGGSKKRLSPARVAALIARAAYNRLDMCWIAKHPVLLLGELLQHMTSSIMSLCGACTVLPESPAWRCEVADALGLLSLWCVL